MDGAGTAKAPLGQCLPLATGTQHIYEGLEYQPGILGLATAARLAHVILILGPLAHWNQRLHPLPEVIGDFP